MTEKENSAIERLNKILKEWQKILNIENKIEREIEMSLYMEEMPFKEIKILLNLISKLKKENEKLKNKNKDLLRKLRNRVKEVKKLTKYSQYKKEFSRLNKQLRQKDKQIDLMALAIINYDDQLVINKYKNIDEVKEVYKELAKEGGE